MFVLLVLVLLYSVWCGWQFRYPDRGLVWEAAWIDFVAINFQLGFLEFYVGFV